jgi:hypothetical protein
MTLRTKMAWLLIVAGIVLLNVAMRMPRPSSPGGAMSDLMTAAILAVLPIAGLSCLIIGILRLVRKPK